MTDPRGHPTLLPGLAALVALGAFLALQAASVVAAGGAFEYPLDDPYIHMAIAEQMRAGGYGVNPGEYAAAASSPLFPILMLPFAGEAAQRYLPLFWNVVGLLAAAWLWGRILWQAGYGTGPIGLVLAAAGPLALHMVGVAHTGMEHALHVAAGLAIVSGLIGFLDTGRIGWLLVLGILFSPLLRFEGLALAILAAAAVMLRGRMGQGIRLFVLAVAPVAAFGVFLTSLGLDPVPSSVSAKLALPDEPSNGVTGFLAGRLASFSGVQQTIMLAFLAVIAILLLVPEIRRSNRALLLLAVGGAGVAHMLFGRFGWMDRYEIYALVFLAAGTFAAALTRDSRRYVLLPLVALVLAGLHYPPRVIRLYITSADAVHVQQAQMGRFAKDYLQEPVAVNDLGHVAWANPNYVLDLWGLASHEARRLRLEAPAPGWVDALADAQGVRFAMIYAHWFPAEVLAEDWVLLGRLKTSSTGSFLGGYEVSFFLTGDYDPVPYVAKIAEWQKNLPRNAAWEFADGVSG